MLKLKLDNQPRWKKGPFGSPDASRTDALDEYIPVPGAAPDIDKMRRPLHERVIIGKKGAGKTLYLRALGSKFGGLEHSSSKAKGSEKYGTMDGWFVFRDVNKLSSGVVIDLSQTLNRAHAFLLSRSIVVDQQLRSRELWTRIWLCAIYAALFNITFGKSKHDAFSGAKSSGESRDNLAAKLDEVSSFLSDLPPTASVTTIINFFANNKTKRIGSIRKYLDDYRWNILAELLEGVMNDAPQTAIFIDALDDDFDQAPNAWLNCQEGLFRCIFEILNKADRFSNRIHVIVALREIVYASLLRSEHANRYLQDEHVRYISWDAGPARSLLFSKIQNLPTEFCVRPELDKIRRPMEYWLGKDRIENRKRDTVEPLSDYILRHTRLLPRDIVIMGNAICEGYRKKYHSNEELNDSDIRLIVHEVSKFICLSALRSSVNEYICSEDYLAEILLHGDESVDDVFDSEETEDQVVLEAIKEKVHGSVMNRANRFFELVGKEIFTRSEMIKALLDSGLVEEHELHDSERDTFFRFDNVLYRHGLIAYESKRGGEKNWRFCWRGTPAADSAILPDNDVRYGFHSSVLDAFDGMIVADKYPIF